jgi:microcystin-dependent protein
MGDVVGRTGDQVVHRNHVVALGQQPVAEMAAQKTGAAGHKNTHRSMNPFHCLESRSEL